MATPTYVPLATLTLASADGSITFSSIPASYRDLILVVEASHSSTAADYDLHLQLNGDAGSNYSYVSMYGLGSGSGASFSGTAAFAVLGNIAKSDRGYNAPNIIQIQDYSATDKHKTMLCRYNSSAYIVGASASRWANTTAVNSITLTINTAPNFKIGSTFSLYGVN